MNYLAFLGSGRLAAAMVCRSTPLLPDRAMRDVPAPGNTGVLTPYAVIGVGEAGSREYRTGTRWRLGTQASLSLDASREEVRGGDTSSNALMMRAAIRF